MAPVGVGAAWSWRRDGRSWLWRSRHDAPLGRRCGLGNDHLLFSR